MLRVAQIFLLLVLIWICVAVAYGQGTGQNPSTIPIVGQSVLPSTQNHRTQKRPPGTRQRLGRPTQRAVRRATNRRHRRAYHRLAGPAHLAPPPPVPSETNPEVPPVQAGATDFVVDTKTGRMVGTESREAVSLPPDQPEPARTLPRIVLVPAPADSQKPPLSFETWIDCGSSPGCGA